MIPLLTLSVSRLLYTFILTQDPIVTPHGVLYDKENILHSLVQQKKAIARKVKMWDEQEAKDAAVEVSRQHANSESDIQKFHELNHGAGRWTNINEEGVESREKGATSANMATQEERDRINTMKAFWLPSKTPNAERKVDKPETDTRCPATMKKLRLKDLIPVRWTKVRSGEAGRYMCPITFRTFTNTTNIVILKTTGDAISEEAYKRVVEKEGSYNGHTVKPKDVIKLQRGGCGFSASGTQVESKHDFLLGMGSGLADLRGQQRGPVSKFGLRFN